VTTEIDNLLPVSLNTFFDGVEIECDFYLMESSGRTQLYRRSGYPFYATDINNLKARGIKCLYIKSSDADCYREHIQSRIMNDNSLSIHDRLDAVRGASKAVMEEAWKQGNVDSTLWVSRELSAQITKLVTCEDFLFQDLLEMMLTDYNSYAHATNVCSFATVIAKAYGIYDREDLIQIGKGALLHDVGKHFCDHEVKKLRGELTREQAKEKAKEHPLVGFKHLSTHTDISWGGLMMVYQHHEQVDGKGYPVGSVGDEIHPWARICAVANFYEKQWRLQKNANRVNIDKLRELLEEKSGTLLDDKVVASLLSILEGRACSK